MASARIALAGMTSGPRPVATLIVIAGIATWNRISGTAEIVCVKYSGTAANIASTSASISCALSLIVPPDREHDRVAVERLQDLLVHRLEQRPRAEEIGRASCRE